MARPIDAGETRAFYGAALTALRYLETRQPTGRRFGADADALWSNFKGDLSAADRIDLMIRDRTCTVYVNQSATSSRRRST